MRCLTRKPAGFTLIELLVVIAIIAILAAVLFPVFANARERGRQATCIANMKQLNLGFRMYMDDNGGRMPSINVRWTPGVPSWAAADFVGSGFQPARVDQGSLWPYIKAKGIYLCPSDRNKAATAVVGQPKDYELSYSVSEMLHLKKLDSEISGNSPSRVAFMVHEARNNRDGGTGGINDGNWDWDAAPGVATDEPANVHYDGTIVSFADGHAKRLSYNELKRLSNERDPVTNNKIWAPW